MKALTQRQYGLLCGVLAWITVIELCGVWVVIPTALTLAVITARTPLGLLNFLVLQWFGVRVCKWYMDASGLGFDVYSVGDRVGASSSDGRSRQWRIVAKSDDVHVRLMRYGVRRWIVPLTGWWTDFRYIARRS